VKKNKYLLIIVINLVCLFFAGQITAKTLFNQAEEEYSKKNYKLAAELYIESISKERNDNETIAIAYYKAGKSNAFLENYSESIEYLKKFISLSVNTVNVDNAAYLLANIYFKTNTIEKSINLKNYILKNFPESEYNNEKYWVWLAKTNNSADNEFLSSESSQKNENIIKAAAVKTNIEYASIDFEKAAIKTIITAIGSITKIEYKIDFFNINDYATVKSDNKIAVSFLPLMLNKILTDYNYDISSFNRAVKISKIVPFLDDYKSLNNFYYILAYSEKDADKIKYSANEIKQEGIACTFFEDYRYLIIQSIDYENVFKFLESLKISTESFGKYRMITYKFEIAPPIIIVDLLNGIKNDNVSIIETAQLVKLKITPKKAVYLRNILTSSENITLLKKIQSITINAESKNALITIPNNTETEIIALLKMLDIELFKNENGIYLYKLFHSSALDAAEQLKELLKDEFSSEKKSDITGSTINGIDQITVDKRTNSILARCSAEIATFLEELIKKLDIKVELPQPELSYKTRIYSLRNARASDLKVQLDSIKNENILRIFNITSDNRTNAIIITAVEDDLEPLHKIITELDRDLTIKNSEYITHTFIIENRKPSFIVSNLNSILFQGAFSKNVDSMKIIPVDNQNKIIVLTNDRKNFNYVEQWIKLFDVKNKEIKKFEVKTFAYICKNIPADDLAGLLNTMIKSIQQMELASQNFNKNNLDDSNNTLLNNSNKNYTYLLSSNISINPDKTSNALLITASEDEYKHLLAAIEKIDKVPDQIYIDVIIAEVALSDKDQFGIEWNYNSKFGSDNSQTFSTNNGLKISETINNIPLSGFKYSVLDGVKFNMLLNFMQTTSKMKILSSPKITTAHNKRASIKVGKEVPVTKITQSLSNDAVNTNLNQNNYITQYTEFKDVGISLDVTPTSIDNNLIGLKIHLVVSDLDQSNQLVTVNGNPVIRKRETETFGTVLSSNTLVIGGLLKQDETTSVVKTPFIGDIPFIGNLFKHEQKQKENTELLIFLRPTLVNINTSTSALK